MSRAALMAPAIKLARDGFVLGQGDAGIMALEADKLSKDLAAARIFLPKGKTLTRGDRLVQTDLAETLAKISPDSPDAMYSGPIVL
jgi:gamma-glutamyltranspeptidase/glutathione hydrolase